MLNGTSLALIVCTRHRPAAVGQLLEAVGAQSVPPDEVLIVDASDDRETEDVVSRYGASWPHGRLTHVHVPQEHRGLTRQRNYGIDRVTSDIVAFLDDDTIPAADYFERMIKCFAAHPDAAGVGGYIVGTEWRPANWDATDTVTLFCHGGWARRDDYRWRLRRLLGLASPLPPGWMPPSGHGRPVSFLPPDGRDHKVEFLMGGASAWRRTIFARHRFEASFAGYGLYEDLDFCIRVSRGATLLCCTGAKLEHHHDASARPNAFHYGTMVVRNGWYVWRERWPAPPAADRLKWWAVTLLLATCRVADSIRGPHRADALQEALGRFWAMFSLGAWTPANRSGGA